MENNWEKIYSTEKLYLAEIIKGVLEENEYRPIILNKTVSGYPMGFYEIYINREDNILKAIKIINEHTE
jgi:hypothetical protein